ncbi:MAG: PASTA domain-containing protein [Candidatus Latescibacterota bacterium]
MAEPLKNMGIGQSGEYHSFNAQKKKGFLFIILAFLSGCAAFIVIMDTVIMPLYLRSGREITSPNLVNKTIEEATPIARSLHLSLVEDSRDFNDLVLRDAIAFQMPAAGTILKPGRRIHVVLSKGPKPLHIPIVIGKSIRDAENEIKDAGLEVIDKQWKASDKYVRGIVAGQYPSGDQEVPETTGVILFIANGRKESNVVMPNLIDLGMKAAMDTLSAYKFNMEKVTIQKEEAPNLLPDTVIDQHPDPGSPTNTSVDVDLVISTSK